MGEKKFTEFTEKTSPVGNDIVLIYDSESSETKKLKLDNLGGFHESEQYEKATVTSDHSITSEKVIFVNAASNNVTVTLPNATTASAYPIHIKRIDNSAYTVTIESAGGTIDGSSSVTLYGQYDYCTVETDGTNWYIIATSLAILPD